MSSKNIMTGIVVALALVLVLVVVLVKSNVFEKEETTTEMETIVETEIVVVSETNIFGDVEFLTMVTKYHRPKYSSLHTYPTTKPSTTEESATGEESTTEETTEVQYVELTSFVHATDENGNRLFEEDGTPITETVVYTVDANSLTTTAPTEYVPETSVVEVTNELGEPVSGMTEIVTLPPPTTTTTTTTSPNTRWDTTTATEKEGGIDIDLGTPERDDVLAEKIVEQINEDRAAQGLAPLTHDTNLKASARTNSMTLAVPSVYGESKVKADYTATTKFGGESLYMMVADATRAKAQSEDVTKIGVGVVVHDGKYYTSVIYG